MNSTSRENPYSILHTPYPRFLSTTFPKVRYDYCPLSEQQTDSSKILFALQDNNIKRIASSLAECLALSAQIDSEIWRRGAEIIICRCTRTYLKKFSYPAFYLISSRYKLWESANQYCAQRPFTRSPNLNL